MQRFKFFIIFLFIASNSVASEFEQMAAAIIKDKDGYTNIRSGKSSKSDVLFKIIDSEVFWITEKYSPSSQWYSIEYSDKNRKQPQDDKIKKGYIHVSRINTLQSLSKMNVRKITNLSSEFTNKNNRVIVKIKPFLKENHIITKSSSGEYLIDNKKPWAYDNIAPMLANDERFYEIDSIEIIFESKKILIKNSFFENIYHIDLDYITVFDYNQAIYIYMQNGEAAGSYEAIFVIKQNGDVARYVNSVKI